MEEDDLSDLTEKELKVSCAPFSHSVCRSSMCWPHKFMHNAVRLGAWSRGKERVAVACGASSASADRQRGEYG